MRPFLFVLNQEARKRRITERQTRCALTSEVGSQILEIRSSNGPVPNHELVVRGRRRVAHQQMSSCRPSPAGAVCTEAHAERLRAHRSLCGCARTSESQACSNFVSKRSL